MELELKIFESMGVNLKKLLYAPLTRLRSLKIMYKNMPKIESNITNIKLKIDRGIKPK